MTARRRRRETSRPAPKAYVFTDYDNMLIEKGGEVAGPENDPHINFKAEFDNGSFYTVAYRPAFKEFMSGGRQEDRAISRLKRQLGI